VGRFAAMWSLLVDLGSVEVSLFVPFIGQGALFLGWTKGLVDAISNGFLGSWPSTAVICVRFEFVLLYLTCNSSIEVFKHYS
jgi:hypothetical protein